MWWVLGVLGAFAVAFVAWNLAVALGQMDVENVPVSS